MDKDIDRSLIEDTIDILKSIIRFDTSPPGNEIVLALYLRDLIADRTGLKGELIGPDPSRKNFIVRLSGNGKEKPLLLLSHMDVVPADPSNWTHHPFSADEAEGCIWGRGAIDMKMMTAMETAIFIYLAKSGKNLNRDVILAATSGEEEGGGPGLEWISKNAFEKIDAEYALSEVGGFSMEAGKSRLYPVMTAEKGFCWLKIKFSGIPGHGSLPRQDHALLHAAAAITDMLTKGFPVKVVEPVGSFLKAMAAGESFPNSLVLKALATPGISRFAIKLIPKGILRDRLRSILVDTANPTMLEAGTVRNMSPENAELTVDCRILPGTDIDSFTANLEKRITSIIKKPISVEILESSPPQTVSGADEMISVMDRIIKQHDPVGRVVPYMITGFTDGRHINKLGVKTLGFTPLKLDPDFPIYELIHGIDERVPVDALAFGVKVLRDIVTEWCVL